MGGDVNPQFKSYTGDLLFPTKTTNDAIVLRFDHWELQTILIEHREQDKEAQRIDLAELLWEELILNIKDLVVKRYEERIISAIKQHHHDFY